MDAQQLLAACRQIGGTLDQVPRNHASLVGGVTETVDGNAIVSGNFLLPARNEQGPFERGYRFHFTAQTIAEFTDAVRAQRSQIMDVRMVLMQRMLRRSNFGCDAQAFMAVVRKAARLEVHGYAAVEELKRFIGFVEQGRAPQQQ